MLYLVLGFIALAYLGANIYMYVKCMQMMHAAPAWVKVDTSVLFLICFLSFLYPWSFAKRILLYVFFRAYI